MSDSQTQDAAPGAPDAGKDIGLFIEPIRDVGADEDAEQAPPIMMTDEWSAYSVVLVVDRSADDSASDTPAVPGADIDAIEIYDDEETRVGVGSRIIDARINDPYEASIQTRPMAALGPSDERAVSLGTQGGFIRVELAGERPLLRRDRLFIFEIDDGRPNDDVYEVFLCRADSEGIAGCRSLGSGQTGKTSFQLD